MERVSKLLSMVLATLIAVSVFTIDSNAMSAQAEAHRRPLTAEETAAIASFFDAKWYSAAYPDLASAYGTDEEALFNHFVNCGLWEQRIPCKAFDVDTYATRNPDLHKAFGDDIVAYYVHYATHQNERGARPGPTKWNALWNKVTVYSVYDFVKGQDKPREGALPVMTPDWHPGVEID